MSDDQAVPDAVELDPDDEMDLPRERLDDDFDVATAREQSHHRSPQEQGPSEADELVDGS